MAVEFDITGLDNLIRTYQGKTRASDQAMKDLAFIYLADTRKRYVKFSRGGGDWKALKPATIRNRRKGKKTKKTPRGSSGTGNKNAQILRDTGLLLNSLTPGTTGSLVRRIGATKIRVGYSTARHPNTKMTFQELADIHHRGLGNVPARPIFVEPSSGARNRAAHVHIRSTPTEWPG